jgi:hypothetical protein
MARSQSLWDGHGYPATRAAGMLATMTAARVGGPTEEGVVNAVRPPDPHPLYLREMGSGARSDEIALMTWNFIGGIGMSGVMGVDDPGLGSELLEISTAYAGDGVYMFSIWTRMALAHVELSAPDDYPRICGELREALEEVERLRSEGTDGPGSS